jgi:uncharacterized membrane protein
MKTDTQTLLRPSTLHLTASVKVLCIGLIAGTLDIADALIFNQLREISPILVLQYIASGLIGPRAFLEGNSSAMLGLLLHYVIAITWTFAYYEISRRAIILNHHPVLSGLSFGLLVYLVMNFIVLPLSTVKRTASTITVASRINGVLALLICIGLTVALLMKCSFEKATRAIPEAHRTQQ